MRKTVTWYYTKSFSRSGNTKLRAKLDLARLVDLPPQTEAMVVCRATQSIKYFSTPYAVTQLADNSWLYAEDGLAIGSSLTVPDSDIHCLPVMNLPDEPRTLLVGTHIGDVHPATSLRQTCEMFWADTGLPN